MKLQGNWTKHFGDKQNLGKKIEVLADAPDLDGCARLAEVLNEQ
jgi:hypothetical protein